MKPTSFIFLGVAVVLMIVGLVICAVSGAAAERTGIDIHNSEQTDTGDMVFDYDFSADSVRKISVEVLDADVHFMTTDGPSHIELVNFSDGTYTFSGTNKIISVTNNANIFSMLQFGTGNFTFDGLRHYFRGTVRRDAKKTVNVYLNPANEVKTVVLSLESGSLSLSDLSFAGDYDISVSGGAAALSGVTNAGTIKFTGSSSALTLEHVSCTTLVSTQHDGGIKADALAVSGTLTAETDSGDISLSSVRPLEEYKAALNSVRGTVNVYGNFYEYGYNDDAESSADINFRVSVNTGNILIT